MLDLRPAMIGTGSAVLGVGEAGAGVGTRVDGEGYSGRRVIIELN